MLPASPGIARADELPAALAPDAVVLAVKPQVMDDVLPAYRRWARPQTLVPIDRRRQDDRRHRSPSRRRGRDHPLHAEHAGCDRPGDHRRLPESARRDGAAGVVRRAARRDRGKRLGRGRGADGRGDGGIGQRPGLCLSADRGAGGRRRPRRAAAGSGAAAGARRPSPAPANWPGCRRNRRPGCAKTSPARAAPPAPRSTC